MKTPYWLPDESGRIAVGGGDTAHVGGETERNCTISEAVMRAAGADVEFGPPEQ